MIQWFWSEKEATKQHTIDYGTSLKYTVINYNITLIAAKLQMLIFTTKGGAGGCSVN